MSNGLVTGRIGRSLGHRRKKSDGTTEFGTYYSYSIIEVQGKTLSFIFKFKRNQNISAYIRLNQVVKKVENIAYFSDLSRIRFLFSKFEI